MNIPSVIGRRKSRVYAVPSSKWQSIKELADKAKQGDNMVLGKNIKGLLDKYADSRQINSSFMGATYPMHVGATEESIKKQLRAYPEVYGKSEAKMYDFNITLKDHQDMPINGPILKTIYGDNAREVPLYGSTFTWDDFQKIALGNSARFQKSMNWYKLTGRQILSAKVMVYVYFREGHGAMAIDYKNIGEGSAVVHDKLIHMTVPRLSESLEKMYSTANQNFTTIQQELVSNAVTDPATIERYLAEARSKLGSLGDEFVNVTHVKIPYATLLEKLYIATDHQKVSCSLSVKFYYKNTAFTPALQYMNATHVPMTIYGSASMIDGNNVGDPALVQQAGNILTSSIKRLSKFNYMVANEEIFSQVMQNPVTMFKYIVDDWKGIWVNNGSTSPAADPAMYQKFKAYNRGFLRSLQSMYSTDPAGYLRFLDELVQRGNFIQGYLNQGGPAQMSFVAASYALYLAYEDGHQKGASDSLLHALLIALNKCITQNGIVSPIGELRAVREGGRKDYSDVPASINANKAYGGPYHRSRGENESQFGSRVYQQQPVVQQQQRNIADQSTFRAPAPRQASNTLNQSMVMGAGNF